MSKPRTKGSARAKLAGDLKRHFECRFCGGVHRRKSREARECRERWRKGKGPPPRFPERPAREARPPRQRHELDPLGGDTLAHVIARALRRGESSRRVAKRVGVNVSRVREVEAKLEAGPRG